MPVVGNFDPPITTKSTPVVTSSGPSINNVAVSVAKSLLTWNAIATSGVKSVRVTLDGKAVASISKPSAAAVGVNYSATMGALKVGTHNYVITVTSKAGKVATEKGSFAVVAPPRIAAVIVSTAKRLISWKIAAAGGLASYSLRINGKVVSQITPPGTPGAGYSAKMGALGAGKHSYLITVTDKVGRVTQVRGSFTLPASRAATSAVFANAARTALATSAKVDWLYDLNGIADSTQPSNSKKDTAATDAVLAGY
jgi:hypothetical protein